MNFQGFMAMNANISSMSERYVGRSAFVLNANAKSVTDRTVSRLVDLVPAGDLFYCRSLGEELLSHHFATWL
jgi:hypothetical protein